MLVSRSGGSASPSLWLLNSGSLLRGCKKALLSSLLLYLCVIGESCPAAPAGELFGMEISQKMMIKGLRMPLGSEGPSLGEITIDEIGMGPRRVDAFLIHLVPQPVLRGMTVRVDRTERSHLWRQALDLCLGGSPIFRQCRIEGIQLMIPHGQGQGQERVSIAAAGAVYGRRGELILRDATITYRERTRTMPRLEIPLRAREGDWSLAGVAP
jgi:hypothetical protein